MSETLRRWLSKQPQPSTVRGEFQGRDDRVVRIGVARSKWRDAEAALEGAFRCEALDESGATLRIWESDDAAAATHKRDNKPGEQSLVEYARLLNEGCDNAVSRNAEAYRLAFEQQSMLVREVMSLLQSLSARLGSIERAWHDMIMQPPAGGNDGDPNWPAVQQLLVNALPAILAGGRMPPPQPPPGAPGPTNGSGQ